jgi:DNA repair exonuclease SbcCD ATPase subunit
LALKTMKEAPTSCPKCEKPWDKGHSELELSQQQSIIDNLLAKKVKLARLAEDAAADFNTYNEALRQIDAENQALGVETKVRALSSRYETLEWKTRNLNPDLTVLESTLARLQRGPDRTALTKKETLFEERTRAYLAAEIAVEASAKELTEAQEALKVVDYWNIAFGPTGISNMILRESIGPLNSVAKRISNLMTGGTINITYDTQRQLSSGLDRPELIIKVENKSGAKRVEGSSKGEAGMLNLLIAETLAEVGTVGARVGWRWYDEVVNSQDPIIRRTVFNYMKETADRLGILIFVVDHHPEVAGYADRILEAAKIADKHSAISWR